MTEEELRRLYEEFCERLWDRLMAGRREYGDDSFRRSVEALLEERDEEYLDGAGWSFISYAAMRRR